MTQADSGNYAILPQALLYSDLSAHAKVIYAALVRHGTDSESCFPSYRRLGELVRCSSSTAKRAVVELEDAGWVERVARQTARGDADSNGFQVYSAPQEVRSQVTPPPVRSDRTPGQERPDPPVTGDPTLRSRVTGEREQLNESKGTRRRAARRAAPSPPLFDTPPPPATPLAAPPDEVAAQRFEEHFWPAWPRRNGRRNGKAAALARWKKLALSDQRAALRGAKAYAAHCLRADEFPMDASRWLNERLWTEWDPTSTTNEPPDPTRGIGPAAGLPNGGRLTAVPTSDAEWAAMGFKVGSAS